jgi:type IV pilus assembly protein PilA
MTPSSPNPARRDTLIGLLILTGVGVTAAGILLHQKAGQSSEDKAVLCVVRQLSAAADQYYLENGVSSVRFEQLVGATNYVKAISPVAGEMYPAQYFQGRTITVTDIAGARTITYAP